METHVVSISDAARNSPALQRRVEFREMSNDDFVTKGWSSGTLVKAREHGFAWMAQLIVERTAFEFGWEFETLPRSRVTFGDPVSEGDCPAVTETLWHVARYKALNPFPEDFCEAKYLNVEYPDGKRREGLGLVIRQTSAKWLPRGNLVFAIIAEYDPATNRWGAAKNPF